MGGSSLGTQQFMIFEKNKKKISFIENLKNNNDIDNNKFLNLVVSKSGETVETIVNANIYIKKMIKIFLSLKIKKIT